MVWYLPVILCDLCMLSGFILINRRDAEHAKVWNVLLSIFLRILSALCGLIGKRLTVRLPSAKIDEKK